MKSTIYRYLALSFAVHAGVYLIVRFERNPPPEVAIIPVEVESIPVPSGAGGKRGSGGETRHRQLRLSDLMLSPGELSALYADGKPSADPGDPTPGTALAAVRHSVLYDHLYQTIESNFFYPEEFKENSIEGDARADIELTRNGEVVEVFYRVRSKNAYVRVFVIQRLRDVFGRGVLAHYLGKTNKVRLRATFCLELTQSDGAVPKVHGGVFGESLSFYRSAKAFGEWSLGPIRGYGIAPQVGMDPGWVVKQYQKMVGKGPVEDPLAKYRNDPAWRAD